MLDSNPCQIQYKRLRSFDFIRGVAIFVILIVHRIHYSWPTMANSEILGEYLSSGDPGKIFVIITIIFFAMASMFYIISGTVNAYSFFWRARVVGEDRFAPDQIKQGQLLGIKYGFSLIVLNHVYRLLFSNGFNSQINGQDPEYPVGWITGLITFQGESTFFWNQLTSQSTLYVIGFNLIVISVVLGYLFKNYSPSQSERMLKILAILAAILLILSPFVKYLLMPLYDQAYSSGNILWAYLLGGICQEFSWFPHLGIGIVGAYFGLLLATEPTKKSFGKKLRRMWIPLLLIGLIGVVIFSSDTALGDRLMKASITYAGTALFVIIEHWGLKLFDFRLQPSGSTQESKSTRFISPFQLFGKLSLTVFLFEGLIAAIVTLTLNALFGKAWTNNIGLVALLGLFCALLWYGMLLAWKKAAFKGSLEWLVAKGFQVQK